MGTPLGLLFFLLLILDFGSSDTELNACQKVYIADRYCCNIICNAGGYILHDLLLFSLALFKDSVKGSALDSP